MFREIITVAATLVAVLAQEDPEYWHSLAKAELKESLDAKPNTNVAKNVIMFLGDGMGISTVTSARVLKHVLKNKTDTAEESLEFEKTEHVGLIKTYDIDYQTPDSAATATAYLAGVKTKQNVIGLTGRSERDNCSSQFGNEITSILDWSLAEGKTVGVISTSAVTHASPAALYAHTANRDWQGDAEMTNETKDAGCKDIAYQLIMENPNIQVILGGGRRYFLPNNITDPSDTENEREEFQRRDGLNLIEEWKQEKEKRGVAHAYVTNMTGLDSIDAEHTDYVLGLFGYYHMNYELDRVAEEPSLADMTRKAIEILNKNEQGFFLFVEGSRIDHAHHKNMAMKSLHDVLAMDEAVGVAKEMTTESDTLLLTTADHSHSLNLIGYGKRGDSLFDIMKYGVIANDSVWNTPLLYANGPGHRDERRNYTHEETSAKDFRQDSTFGRNSATHTGEDVAVYAKGPMSHLFRSVHEQNYIAHVMAYASCVGEYAGNCGIRPDPTKPDPDKCTNSASDIVCNLYLLLVLSVLMLSLFR